MKSRQELKELIRQKDKKNQALRREIKTLKLRTVMLENMLRKPTIAKVTKKWWKFWE